MLLLVFLAFPFLPEKMEKGVILEAHLKEERSSWNIKIFGNNNYRVRRSGLGGFKDYEGKYVLKNDTLKIERFDCNQCHFTNEYVLGDKNLIPLYSDAEDTVPPTANKPNPRGGAKGVTTVPTAAIPAPVYPAPSIALLTM